MCSPMAHIFAYCFTPGHIFFLNNNAFYKLEKTKFLCLSSNLSCPEDLKKQWLPFSILSLLPFLISPSLSSIPSCSSDQFSVLLNKHFMFHSVSLLSQAPLARWSRALPSVLYIYYLEMVGQALMALLITLYHFYQVYLPLPCRVIAVNLLYTLFFQGSSLHSH